MVKAFLDEKSYKRHYKTALLLPLIMVLISFFFIYQAIQVDGTPIYRDISLKGGLSAILTVGEPLSSNEFQSQLENQFPDKTFSVSTLEQEGKAAGYIVDTNLDEDSFESAAEQLLGVELDPETNYSANFISPSLSASFFSLAVTVLAISFVLMSLVIFIYFREIIPSGAVVLSAFFDVVVTIGVLNMLGFEISIAGIGALLMLIGYSIDTDVLLTNRLVKEFGDNYFEKLGFAWKTGTLMTLTTLSAGVAALMFTNSHIIFEIAFILVIGLLVDYISTWVQNAGILMWWLYRR